MQNALIVDDNREMANSLQQMLSLFDIEAEVAYGSRPALVALQSASPKIVFLDLNMPGVSGFEVLGYLKREPRLADVPVIVVTSDDQPETARRAEDAGVSATIIKPVSYEMLETALKKINII